ncbi:MAG: esterase family protein [Hungatella sp.]|nr:esterase family protein [Hungatella sp.]
MSFFEGTIYSKTLHMDTQLGVILPQDSRPHVEMALAEGLTPRQVPRTLILLHGLTDSASVWWRRTSIERYAEVHDIAVIMPEVYKSYYQDMKHGENFFTYISEELPVLCETLFHVAVDPDNLMIAGLSMGGYGALRCALTYPGRYAACGAFSSGCNIRGSLAKSDVTDGPAKGFIRSLRAIFGENLEIPDESDIYWLAQHLGEEAKKIRMYMTCGRQDFLYEDNLKLKGILETCGLKEFVYEDWDGIHEWGYWDVAIQRFLKIFVK